MPLAPDEFASSMAQFGPFEAAPHLAVAVSGGRDSMALALLADRWARDRGGRVTALIVDHGLRAEAADEATRVRSWLGARGIAADILVWRHDGRPRTRIQELARTARYGLLAGRCAADGILHLLVAHHAGDQAETFVQRLLRGSGADGLAGMAACIELPGVRILRPLLDVPRERLEAGLTAVGQDWIEDPSNQDPRFDRVALRRAGLPLPPADACAIAAAMARLRTVTEGRVAAALAGLATIHPLGAVILEPKLAALPDRLAMAVVAAAVVTAGGRDHPPRRERLAGTVAALRAAEGRPPAEGRRDRTLGGCRILWRQSRWLVVRDPAAIVPGPADTFTGRWDGRFELAGAPEAGDVAARGMDRGLDRHRHRRRATPGLPVMAASLPDVPEAHFRPLRPLAAGAFFPCFGAGTRQM